MTLKDFRAGVLWTTCGVFSNFGKRQQTPATRQRLLPAPSFEWPWDVPCTREGCLRGSTATLIKPSFDNVGHKRVL